MQNQMNLWIRQSRHGDRDAFARIVQQYQAKVCAVTFSMTGDLQKSEDVAQETFLTAWNKLGSLQEPDKIGAWLCAIARSLCKKGFQRNRRDPLHAAAPIDQHPLEPTEIPFPSEEAEDEIRRKQADMAWSAIAEIPEQYREPMVLYYREGRSVRDVAETLELTETCVKQRLHRGRQYLKQELERLVESALASTRPDAAFTLAVVSSIPVAAAAAGLLVATPAMAAESSVGSGGVSLSATVGSGSFWGIVGGLFGILALPFIFLASGLFGVWNCIRNAPTVRTRRYMVRSCLIWYVINWLVFGFLIFILPSIQLAVHKIPEHKIIDQGLLFLAFFLPIFFLGQVCYRWRRILAEDWSILPNSDRPLEESFLSQKKINRTFWFAAGVPSLLLVLGILAIGSSSHSFSVKDLVDVVFFAFLMIVAHGAFLGLISRGIRISRNEDDLRQTPPKNTAWLTSFRNEMTTRGLGTRSAMIVDIVLMFLLASPYTAAILIPQTWIPASKTVTVGLDGILFMLLIPELIAIYFITQFAGRPCRRLQGYSRLCVSMGVFVTATVLLIRFPVQSMRLSLLWDQPREYLYPYFEGLVSELPSLGIVLGFYFGLALTTIVVQRMTRRRTASDNRTA